MFVTDITNCYGSIYTHTIDWAMVGKEIAKLQNCKRAKEQNKSLGHTIDTYIQGMQYGQTNGIPQGSSLFDFIAEIVLGYADRLLADKVAAREITDYRILRYRDDYRIFSNSKEELESITQDLQGVLSDLNFQMNSSKTHLSDNIVEEAIKPDKLYYIANIPAYRKNNSLFNSFQKELYYILTISKKYPNSGIVCRLITNINRRFSHVKCIKENIRVLIGIATEIAMYSPKVYQPALALISKLIEKLNTKEEREEQIQLVYNKFKRLPNIGHIQIWMQRITFKSNKENDKHPYDEKICKLVEGKNVKLWNNDWIKAKFCQNFPMDKICNVKKRDLMTPSIEEYEFEIFDY